MKTYETKITDIKRNWQLVDVKGKTLGRIASHIAVLLMGKGKPYFTRHLDCGDFVVVVNAQKVSVTGKKLTDKIYTTYSGYPGGLRREALRDLLSRRPEEVIRRAVTGMLPKNKLRDRLLARLYVFPGETHPYEKELKAQSASWRTKIKTATKN